MGSRRSFVYVLAASVAASACGAKSGLRVPAETGVDAGRPHAKSDKMDLVLVIDDSRSMADKQAILADTVTDLVSRLVAPPCVGGGGAAVAGTADPKVPCPAGSAREFRPVQDVHVAVISTSLGGQGLRGYDAPGEDRKAHLLYADRYGFVVPTYDDRGFLAWDPARKKSPPGENDAARFADNLRAIVEGVGERGSGLEAQLEAWYRFLVDPEPYDRLEPDDCFPGQGTLDCSRPAGLDTVVLHQRADFLRPDSLVVVVMLTDENDCSIADGARALLSLPTPLPPGTSRCLSDPSDPCCHSCAAPAPPGCPPPAHDPRCTAPPDAGLAKAPTCMGLRRYLGVEVLHPPSRYAAGLVADRVPDRAGHLVDNPLLRSRAGDGGASADAGRRDRELVYIAGIVGVPWQDVARDPSDPADLRYMTAAEIEAAGRWPMIVGDPDHGVAPGDPLMIESVEPRTGVHPVTGAPLAPPSATSPKANPVNGHEMARPSGVGVQYACIFDLPQPRDCLAPGTICDCAGLLGKAEGNPVCQADDGGYGTVQYRGKAHPGLRELAVLRDVGHNAIVASVCARNLTDGSRPDYGYRPALGAIVDRLREGLY